jgi:glutamate N-acetyltransferase/amino-acid N-acetyltransferase
MINKNKITKTTITIIKNGTITTPAGFYAEAIASGIKQKNKLDLALLYSNNTCLVSAKFTQNKLNGESLKWTKKIIKKNNSCKALLVNSGNANTAVGAIGLTHAKDIAKDISKKLKIKPQEVALASTGVIGIELPMNKIKKGIEKIELGKKSGQKFSEAILTTDTHSKQIAIEIKSNNAVYKIAGTAKGAGMIHPNLATMLAFITTDASLDKKWIDKTLAEVVNQTFNMIDIDMDTSPCDMVMLMANGDDSVGKIDSIHPSAQIFKDGIYLICEFLAKEIARDGEGATRLIEAKILGAKNNAIAKKVARSIISSLLIKTMVKGKDPNWGRIISTIGNTTPKMNEKKITIHIGKIKVYDKGVPISANAPSAIQEMSNECVLITINFDEKQGTATAWGCDLTEEYVKINSEMTT